MAEPMDVDHVQDNNHHHQNQSLEEDGNQDSTYENVRWKKQMGSLFLSASTGISFRPAAASASATIDHYPSMLVLEWKNVVKHQVSPVTYPKSMLKLTLSDGSTTTFQMIDRVALQAIRKDITQRLHPASSVACVGTNNSKKRPFSKVSSKTNANTNHSKSARAATPFSSSFGEMDATALAVTRSTLLAAHPALRQQHEYLVGQQQSSETMIISEEDFWKTHADLLEEEYARMSGVSKAGTSSLLQSHVPSSGRVTLGVEEMRQIFILYPAVHKAYEEKVPLELSDEQFWRKYLESEFFHRDRGRMGVAARNFRTAASDKKKKPGNTVGDKKKEGPTLEEQDARAAAVGTDDIFSRYDAKLQQQAAAAASAQNGANGDGTYHHGSNGGDGNGDGSHHHKKTWGTHLAVGQFDLAQTLETERGEKLLQGPRDNHPPNQADDEKGGRVIQKYNRHWAMVLHPEEAVAGSNLLQVARKSVQDATTTTMDTTTTNSSTTTNGNNAPAVSRLDGGSSRSSTSRVILQDASAGGGVHEEFSALVDFASAHQGDANHATGIGVHEGLDYEPLTLHNVEAYSYAGQQGGQQLRQRSGGGGAPSDEASRAETAKKHATLYQTVAAKTEAMAATTAQDGAAAAARNGGGGGGSGAVLLSPKCFPPPVLGRELLSALTKKMAQDSRTEAASLEMVSKLPDDFRKRLQAFFRRSSELLRHFFGLRRLSQEPGNSSSTTASIDKKLARIVRAMESLYREMEGMRKDLPQSEEGEMMRKMCLPIMDQLDLAFKLHREGSGRGGGGGFVDVDEN